MLKLSRRLRVERLESRCLFAVAELGDQPTNVASVSLQDAASIDVTEVKGLRGAALEISFDHQRLQVDPRDVRAGSAWGGKGMSIANVDNDEGTINVFVFSVRETELSHGSLIEIDFQRSDSDDNSVLPLIDINRLRLNDNEISFADSNQASSTSSHDGSDGPPKLSLQFKIAAEGESSLIADRPDESAVDVLANADEASEPQDEHRNQQQTDLPTAFEDRLSDDSRSESIEDYVLYPGYVCKPLKIAGVHVDLAFNQWASSGSALKGPLVPAVEQDLVLYAPLSTNADGEPEPEMELEPLRSIGIHNDNPGVSGLADVSIFPSVAIRQGFIAESDFDPESPARPALQQLDEPLSHVPFQSDLTKLAISRLPISGTHR